MFGNNVSKSINKTRRRFDINLIKKRFYIPEEDKWITLKIKASVLKTINKKGISAVIKEAKAQGAFYKYYYGKERKPYSGNIGMYRA